MCGLTQDVVMAGRKTHTHRHTQRKECASGRRRNDGRRIETGNKGMQSKEEGGEGRIKRMNCWCRDVWKIDRGRIYLSPDGSVLGVHLWRNEISGRLSGRGRLCCPAAYTLTQHPACSVCSHTTCSAFNLPDRHARVCMCICVHRSRGLQGGLLSHAASPSSDPGCVFHSALPRWLFGSSPAGSQNLQVEPRSSFYIKSVRVCF